MKNLFLLLLFITLLSCDDDSNNSTFLPNATVNFTVNLNLSEGNNLLIPGGHAVFSNRGIRGVVVYRRSADLFVAFDLACPHINLQDCSTMTVGALFMTCPCDNERFQIIDGAPENGNIQHAARFYNVTLNGNLLRITN